MNQFELALQQFKANLKQTENKTKCINKYLNAKGKYNSFKSEQVRQDYLKNHPKVIKANIKPKKGITHQPHPLLNASIVLNRIFCK